VVDTVNGPQLAYNGHLLHRFAKQPAPGQVNGDAAYSPEGVWIAATPGIAYQPWH
jgi:hypothetical protein